MGERCSRSGWGAGVTHVDPTPSAPPRPRLRRRLVHLPTPPRRSPPVGPFPSTSPHRPHPSPPPPVRARPLPPPLPHTQVTSCIITSSVKAKTGRRQPNTPHGTAPHSRSFG